MSKTPLQERVRQRFRQLVDAKKVPHETLGKYLGLSRSGVTRLLSDEGSGFALHHIEKLCEFFQITASEVIMEPGALIQPLTVMEAAFLAQLRLMTDLERHSLMVVLQSRTPAYVTGKGRTARLGRARLTPKEQELVDLFGQVKKEAVREGVLKMLRGAAEDDDVADQGKARTRG